MFNWHKSLKSIIDINSNLTDNEYIGDCRNNHSYIEINILHNLFNLFIEVN